MTASAARAQAALRRGDHLVGREAALELLVGAATAGPGVVVGGPPGVGRTTVLAAARARLVEAGTPTVVVRPAEPGTGPFAALRPVLGEATPTSVDAASLAAAGLALEALGAPGGEGPRLVVVVDGVDALDGPDAAVVHQVVARRRAHLLASVRPREPAAADEVDPWWWDVAGRVDLPPLERADADALAERLVGGPLAASARERLWTSARGRPGWLVALVAAVRDGDGWVRDAGLWDLAGDEVVVAEVDLLDRLVALPDEVRAVLEALALVEALPIADAEALGGPGPLVEGERRGLVRTDEVGDGLRCALASRLVGSALRSGMDPVDEVARWARVADVLAASADASPATALARARALAGVGRAGPHATDEDLDVVLAGAAAAHTLSRWSLVVELAGRVWRVRGDADALALLAVAHGEVGDHEAIRALSDELGTVAVAGDALASHATAIAVSQFHSDDPDGAFATVERARAAAGPVARAMLDVFEGRLRSFAGDQARARALTDPWCDADDPELRVEALTVRASLAGLGGDPGAAVADFEAALALALALPDAPGSLAGVPFLFRLGALAEAGRLEEALAGAEAVQAETVRSGDATSRGWVALHLGRCHLAVGRPRAAARAFAQAVTDLRAVHRPGWSAHPAAGLVAAHAAVGDLGAATQARDAWAQGPPHAVALFRPEELRLTSWLAAAEGDLAGAAALLEEAADRARRVGSVPYRVAALHDRVRLDPGPGGAHAARALAALARTAPGALVDAHARQACALVEGDTEALAAVAATYGDLGARLDEAETWAEVARRAEDERERAVAAHRVPAALDPLDRPTTPLLADVAGGPGLTGREREVAEMVAAGASRREVAESLVVSVRTVDSHLQRVYRKLGVRGRDGLVAALAPDGAG